jgi:hypothetical protein
MTGFSFNPEEKWEVSTESVLPSGNHVVNIEELVEGTSSGNYPQVTVRSRNPQGMATDWITISSPQTFGKFTAFILALGVAEADYPQAGEDFDPENGRVKQSYLDKIYAKYGSNPVGVVVRDEPDNRKPGQTQTRVKGWVPAVEIKPGSDATPPGSQQDFATAGAGKAADDDIPF